MDKYKMVLLHFAFFVYSLAGILSKKASQDSFFSMRFFVYYGIVVCILLIYALIWQQLLKKMDVTTAYMNKAVTVIWGMIWGYLIFDEHITISKLIGLLLIVIGVFLVASNDKQISQRINWRIDK